MMNEIGPDEACPTGHEIGRTHGWLGSYSSRSARVVPMVEWLPTGVSLAFDPCYSAPAAAPPPMVPVCHESRSALCPFRRSGRSQRLRRALPRAAAQGLHAHRVRLHREAARLRARQDPPLRGADSHEGQRRIRLWDVAARDRSNGFSGCRRIGADQFEHFRSGFSAWTDLWSYGGRSFGLLGDDRQLRVPLAPAELFSRSAATGVELASLPGIFRERAAVPRQGPGGAELRSRAHLVPRRK